MKILLTHRYFWPDTAPYATMLRSIGNGLAAAGHDVSVFASAPSYRDSVKAAKREKLGALDVFRTFVFQENRKNPMMRVLNVFLYCVALFFHIILHRPQVVTASTFPPVAAGWFASLAAKLSGAKFIYHLQDIHPEVSKYSGGRIGRGFAFRALRWLDNQTLRRASVIVVLSKDMRETLQCRQIGDLNIQIINNFLLDDFSPDAEIPADLVKQSGVKRAIFAGNLGRFQNLELLAEGVAGCFQDFPELELLFLGDGTALPALKAKWQDNPNVRFGPFLPFGQARQLIRDADVGLVSLMPDIYRVAYPSKVLTYLGLQLPVLALIEPDSNLAQDLQASGCGRVPEAATPKAISNALAELLRSLETGPAVSAADAQKYTETSANKNWLNLMNGLAETVPS